MSARNEMVATIHRYEFGRNWQRFLASLNDEQISAAERSLRQVLELEAFRVAGFWMSAPAAGSSA
jgi:hypothetical protein